MGGGAGSLTYQVQEAFKALLRPGESKRMAKRVRQAEILAATGEMLPLNRVQVDHIFSFKTMRVYTNLSIGFVTWAKREYGIRHLTQLDMATMATRYLREEMVGRRSAYTVKTVYAALSKVPVAVRHRWGCDVGRIEREALGRMPVRRLEDRIWAGEYQPEEFEAIVRWLRAKRSKKAGLAAIVVEVQRHCGLRISEAVGLRARMVDVGAGVLRITDTNITKGGRDRGVELPVPPHLMERLAPLAQAALAARGPEARVLPLRDDYVRRLVREACGSLGIRPHGTHGFRHSYANARFCQLVAAGADREAAQAAVAEDLGHSRPGITTTYVRY